VRGWRSGHRHDRITAVQRSADELGASDQTAFRHAHHNDRHDHRGEYGDQREHDPGEQHRSEQRRLFGHATRGHGRRSRPRSAERHDARLNPACDDHARHLDEYDRRPGTALSPPRTDL
jgi:hypothetical protein